MSAVDKIQRLVILDRDGVINEDSSDFVKSVEEWIPIPGSIEAIAALSAGGYTVAVASNQSGIARGLFDIKALDEMHRKLSDLVVAAGGRVECVAVCPHGPHDGCECRKPKPGLLLQIGEHLAFDLDGVPVIGDSLRDLEAAVAAGAKPILVRTGNGGEVEARLPSMLESVPVFDDLAAAASNLLAM